MDNRDYKAMNKDTHTQPSCLTAVMPRFSVSLVYIKNIVNGNETALRVLITKASSEEEALGKAIINFNDEMANFNLSCKVVIRLNEA